MDDGSACKSSDVINALRIVHFLDSHLELHGHERQCLLRAHEQLQNLKNQATSFRLFGKMCKDYTLVSLPDQASAIAHDCLQCALSVLQLLRARKSESASAPSGDFSPTLLTPSTILAFDIMDRARQSNPACLNTVRFKRTRPKYEWNEQNYLNIIRGSRIPSLLATRFLAQYLGPILRESHVSPALEP